MRETRSANMPVNVSKGFVFVLELFSMFAKELDTEEQEVEALFLGFLAFHLVMKNEETRIAEVLERMKQWTGGHKGRPFMN